MKPALCLLLGMLVPGLADQPTRDLTAALDGYNKTTAELRKTSERLRGMCRPPRVQHAIEKDWL